MPEPSDRTIFLGVGAAVLGAHSPDTGMIRLQSDQYVDFDPDRSFPIDRRQSSLYKLNDPRVIATQDDADGIPGPTSISREFPKYRMIGSLYLAEWYWNEELTDAQKVEFPPSTIDEPDQCKSVVYWPNQALPQAGHRYHGFWGTLNARADEVEVRHWVEKKFQLKTIPINLKDERQCDRHTSEGGLTTISPENREGAIYLEFEYAIVGSKLGIPKLPPGLQ